jgi:excisionase family DNA binding protein
MRKLEVEIATKPSRAKLQRFHSVTAVALELDVSEKTVRRWIVAGELPYHRLGRQIRVADDDLRSFLAMRRKA